MDSCNRVIALLTDFGADSYYVAQMKGVILQSNPNAVIVDITHSIAPQNIRGAALILDDCIQSFPSETIFVVVVDPGVGTNRKIVIVETQSQMFVCPDNGLLSVVLKNQSLVSSTSVDPSLLARDISTTFHGRDIMAPIAARISLGESTANFGSSIENLTMHDFPEPFFEVNAAGENEIVGEIMYADSFGNLITNIRSEMLDVAKTPAYQVSFGQSQAIDRVSETYASGNSGEPLALIGSNGRLEIAISDGSAFSFLGV